MRILHSSDLHSTLPQLRGKWDIILDTGDFLPDSHYLQTSINQKAAFQLQWLQTNAVKIKDWVLGRPFLFVQGNHDFLPPHLMEAELRSVGIDAHHIGEKLLSFQGVNFYGFPFVPTINGQWNYEKTIPEMQIEVNKMVNVLNNQYVDVLACHSPMAGTLDETFSGVHIGSTVIANAIDYQINEGMRPQLYACGHCHNPALKIERGMLVSNMATRYTIIEI